jgi:hypothetical protein
MPYLMRHIRNVALLSILAISTSALAQYREFKPGFFTKDGTYVAPQEIDDDGTAYAAGALQPSIASSVKQSVSPLRDDAAVEVGKMNSMLEQSPPNAIEPIR